MGIEDQRTTSDLLERIEHRRSNRGFPETSVDRNERFDEAGPSNTYNDSCNPPAPGTSDGDADDWYRRSSNNQANNQRDGSYRSGSSNNYRSSNDYGSQHEGRYNQGYNRGSYNQQPPPKKSKYANAMPK